MVATRGEAYLSKGEPSKDKNINNIRESLHEKRFTKKYNLIIFIKMPRRRNQKKNARRKRNNVPRSRMLALGPTYPNGLIAKHKYTEATVLQGSYTQGDIPSTAMYSFRCASMFDPDRAAGGHQPLFYDEMSLIYNQYRVLGARARIRYVNMSDEPVIVFGAHLGAPLGAGWEADSLLERKDIKSRILSAKTGGKNVATINLYYSPSKFYNQSKAHLRNDKDLVGSHDGNVVPAKTSFFEIGMAQVSTDLGDQDAHKVKIFIEIEYTAFWNDRKLKISGS